MIKVLIFGGKHLEKKLEFSCNDHHFQKGTNFELLSILFAILIYARIRIFFGNFRAKKTRDHRMNFELLSSILVVFRS